MGIDVGKIEAAAAQREKVAKQFASKLENIASKASSASELIDLNDEVLFLSADREQLSTKGINIVSNVHKAVDELRDVVFDFIKQANIEAALITDAQGKLLRTRADAKDIPDAETKSGVLGQLDGLAKSLSTYQKDVAKAQGAAGDQLRSIERLMALTSSGHGRAQEAIGEYRRFIRKMYMTGGILTFMYAPVKLFTTHVKAYIYNYTDAFDVMGVLGKRIGNVFK